MNQKKGFTLIELLVVMGLVTTLFTISVLSFSNIEKEVQLDSLISGVKFSIVKAQSQTVNGTPAGLYFETNRYVYFYGDQFTQGDPENQITDLPNGIVFSVINVPTNSITFAKITGYVKNYTSPETIVLLDQGTSKSRQLTINNLGLVEVE